MVERGINMTHDKLRREGRISKAQYDWLVELKKMGNLNMYHWLEKRFKKNPKGKYRV